MRDPYLRNRLWWDTVKERFPYHVRTDNGIHPPAIKPDEFGEHASTVLEIDVRTWGFETEAGRDAFAAAFSDRVL